MPLRVAWRKDKEPTPDLCSLWRRGKQICQVSPTQLTPLGAASKDFDANRSAEQLMIAVGEAYETNKIGLLGKTDEPDFYDYRNKIAPKLKLNLELKKRPVLKRPAAATETKPLRLAAKTKEGGPQQTDRPSKPLVKVKTEEVNPKLSRRLIGLHQNFSAIYG